MADWESIFKTKGKFFEKPEPEAKKFVRILKKNKAKRILDLGCGSGRHTILLAKSGFDVYSMDISKSGLKLTREWLKNENLDAKLKHASCYERFPYKDDFFDGIISTQVIHHNYRIKVKACISEIIRVLKPNGLLLVTMPYKKNTFLVKKYKIADKYKTIDEHTFMPTAGLEKGVLHFLYNRKLLKEEFSDFEIMEIYRHNGHNCLFGRLK